MNLFHVATRTLLAVAGVGLMMVPANAGTIEIQLSGLNLTYSAASDTVVDAGGAAGGNHLAAQADPLQAAVFLVDGVAQLPPLMTSEQYGDFFEGLSGSIIDTTIINPSVGSTDAGGSGYGFEWFQNSGGVPQSFLDLEFNNLTYILTPTAFFLTGTVSALSAQQLPYGLAFDPSQPITIAYQSTNFQKLVTVGNGTATVTSIVASGQLTITGQSVVPEPAAVVLLGGMLGLAGYLRHRWQ